MYNYHSTQIHPLFSSLSGEIDGWRLHGFDRLGRPFGEASPADFEQYSIDCGWILTEGEPRVSLALGFRFKVFDGEGGMIGRLFDLESDTRPFKVFADGQYRSSSATEALGDFEKELQQRLGFQHLQLEPHSCQDGAIYGTTKANTAVPQVAWTCDSEGTITELHNSMPYGAEAHFKDCKGRIWGAVKQSQPSSLSWFLPTYWEFRGNAGGHLQTLLPHFEGDSWNVNHMEQVDDHRILYGMETPKGYRYVLFDTQKMASTHHFEIPQSHLGVAVFGIDDNLNLFYSASSRRHPGDISLHVGSLTSGTSMTLRAKLGEVEGMSEEDIKDSIVWSCTPDGRLLLVRLMSDGSGQRIWELAPTK